MASTAHDSGATGLVCTEKDAVKLSASHLKASDMPIWIAEQEVTGAESLLKWIVDSLSNLNRATIF
jgi:tetraacyldisaccharide-1-P 4'-kinase